MKPDLERVMSNKDPLLFRGGLKQLARRPSFRRRKRSSGKSKELQAAEAKLRHFQQEAELWRQKVADGIRDKSMGYEEFNDLTAHRWNADVGLERAQRSLAKLRKKNATSH